jgi:TetR/AcrR family transcriptional regulator
MGEHERLKRRANQILARLETQLKQLLRESEVKEGLRTRKPVGVCVDLMITQLDGRLISYVRSGFERKPRKSWADHWQLLADAIFA